MDTPAVPDLLKIDEVTRRTGLRPSALRFYESAGLITSSGRERTRRLFDQSVLIRLALITVCRRSGFTIREISDLLATRPAGVDAWRPLVARKIAELDARIAHDTSVREGLSHALNCPAPDILSCPHMLATLDAALPAAGVAGVAKQRL
jgi:DNA-binding transcriptional MerR regulator